MNTKDYTYLLNKPYSLTERQSLELEGILSEFPYLQSARAIRLKGLYNQDSFRYNLELKKTAAYTTDRTILFDFITSEQFISIQKDFFEEKEKSLSLINVTDSEIIKPEPQPAASKLEESIKLSIKEADSNEKAVTAKEEEREASLAEETAQKLGTGKPLQFSKNEKHSFAEWLQLSKLTPVERNSEPEKPNPIDRKMELIDRFIEINPKIVPDKNTPVTPVNINKNNEDTSFLMTETLAKVYLEQRKYQKAIQAYEILILKYPEKSVFFADRISDIKILQQNNN
ncbi:tetratricopeptide repeat protein [Flavobacterium sp. MK4S-17]|uniref:tetratricopeptide repeat protein n=1 Tax=Flavobacterium sp. MK4S-17 TaxID=2543737 RepID=UPI001357D3B0|nr:tetratricopeptide repeat protein [Flavobacterium sp. MK4S-17]